MMVEFVNVFGVGNSGIDGSNGLLLEVMGNVRIMFRYCMFVMFW